MKGSAKSRTAFSLAAYSLGRGRDFLSAADWKVLKEMLCVSALNEMRKGKRWLWLLRASAAEHRLYSLKHDEEVETKRSVLDVIQVVL